MKVGARMTRLNLALVGWGLVTVAVSIGLVALVHIGPCEGRHCGPLLVLGWREGRVVARMQHVQDTGGDRGAALAMRRARQAWAGTSPEPTHITLHRVQGTGWLPRFHPLVSAMSVVPWVDGLAVTRGAHTTYYTPQELMTFPRAYTSMQTPIPDLSVGYDVDALISRSVDEGGHGRARVRRFRAQLIAEHEYPRRVTVNAETLRQSAEEGARFLLRHMSGDGRFSYVYNAQHDRVEELPYNLPRHSGVAYFLAEMGHLLHWPEAREASLRALRWTREHHIRSCGSESRWCVEYFGYVDLGSAALTLLHAAEILRGGHDPLAREVIERVAEFLRYMQRDDGEFRHEYNVVEQRPVDVQYLYYTGEAALALFRAYDVTRNVADLDAARRALRFLTVGSWDFFGSRYYYGEEHWTCQAALEASRWYAVPEALDFCLRWASYSRALQYQPRETLWPVAGAYGAGNLIPPRFTPVGSRTEAFVATYKLAQAYGRATPELKRQIEQGLRLLMSYQWLPGPDFLFKSPERARGGMPGSPTELVVRNDYVQHAGSAMIQWWLVLPPRAPTPASAPR
jgi:hypothetical protein